MARKQVKSGNATKSQNMIVIMSFDDVLFPSYAVEADIYFLDVHHVNCGFEIERRQ